VNWLCNPFIRGTSANDTTDRVWSPFSHSKSD